jgi:hypothetical protein
VTEINLTDSALSALSSIAWNEAGNDAGTPGRMAVVNTVLNRVAAGSQAGFADNVLGVIEQPGQFEPVMRAGSVSALPNAPPYVRDEILALLGDYQDYSGGATFFLNPTITNERGTNFGTGNIPTRVLGNHNFYNQYRDNDPVTFESFTATYTGGQFPTAEVPTLNPVPEALEAIEPALEDAVVAAPGQVDWIANTRAPAPIPFSTLRESQGDGPGIQEVAGAAIAQNWLLVQAFEEGGAPAPDPTWVPDPDLMEEMLSEVPEHLRDNFRAAESAAQAEFILARTLESVEQERILASAGGWGTAASVAAGFIDPVNFIPVGGALSIARQGNRARRALMAGGSASAFNAAYESALVALKPTGDNLDIAYAAAGGAVLGGLIGGLSRGAEWRGAGRSMMGDVDRARAGGDVPGQTVGAAVSPVRPNDPLSRDADDLLEQTSTAPVTALGGLRFSAMGRLMSSRNSAVRALSSQLAEDAVGNADRTRATSVGATEVQQQVFNRSVTNFRRSYEPALESWMGNQGASRWSLRQRSTLRNTFGGMVADAVRSADPTARWDPEVNQVVETFRRLTNDFRELAQNPGLLNGRTMRAVKGFENVEANPNYIPRYIDASRVNEFVDTYGTAGMRRMIGGSLRENLTDASEEMIDRIAKGYVDRITRLAYGEDAAFSRTLEGDPDALKEFLGDILDADGVDYVVNALAARKARSPSDSGAHARGKRRLWLDENYEIAVASRKTGNLENVRISSLLNNNIEDVVNRYSREMSGLVARGQIRVEGKPGRPDVINGITSQAEWEEAVNKIRASWAQLGGRGDTVGEAKASVDRLNWLHDQILGRADPGETGKGAEVMRFLRKFQFLRVAGQLGFAQIPEFGNILSQTGWRAAVTSMPSLRALRRNIKTGRVGDELIDELEAVSGLGAERLTAQMYTRMTEWGSPATIGGQSPRARTVDNLMDKGQALMSDISGMAPVNTLMNRWAMRAIVHRYADLSTSTKGIPKSVGNRLRAMGLSDADLKGILSEFRIHSTRLEGPSGRRVGRLNLDKWTDMEARTAFDKALFREGRRIVQQNDPGQMMLWMSKPVARVLTQFRTFMVGAWEKQFLYNIHMKDFATFSTFTMSTVLAGLTWMVQSHIRAVAMPEDKREEYLERNLSYESIGLAAFQRSGFATLIPVGADFAAGLVGQDPIFDFRSTGLGTGLLGNPTLDFIDKASYATGRIIGPLTSTSDDFDQEDAAAIRSLAPFQNFLPFQYLYSQMMSGLPEDDG